MTDGHAWDQGDRLRSDDPEISSTSPDDPAPPRTLEECLSLHDYEVEDIELSPERVKVEIDCPKCDDRTLFYDADRWSR